MRNFNVLSRRSFLDRSLKTSLGVALSTLVERIRFVQAFLNSGTGDDAGKWYQSSSGT